ncbi:hypothetical protein F5Y16DRAFT_422699 [Xylariaceae sp. FL0255]|nr:hypothetical protein F5Y16DRAFT_422699 [Xylariaceae sp. FL0255]
MFSLKTILSLLAISALVAATPALGPVAGDVGQASIDGLRCGDHIGSCFHDECQGKFKNTTDIIGTCTAGRFDTCPCNKCGLQNGRCDENGCEGAENPVVSTDDDGEKSIAVRTLMNDIFSAALEAAEDVEEFWPDKSDRELMTRLWRDYEKSTMKAVVDSRGSDVYSGVYFSTRLDLRLQFKMIFKSWNLSLSIQSISTWDQGRN